MHRWTQVWKYGDLFNFTYDKSLLVGRNSLFVLKYNTTSEQITKRLVQKIKTKKQKNKNKQMFPCTYDPHPPVFSV